MRSLHAVTATVLLLAVAGCGVGVQPDSSTPVATASPSPSVPVAAADPGPVAEIVLGAVTLSARDDEGTEVAGASLDGPLDEVVSLFDSALGFEPSVVTYAVDDCTGANDITVYSWGDAVTVMNQGSPTELTPWRVQYPYWVRFSAADTNGVTLTTAGSITVGTPSAPVFASLPTERMEQISATAYWGALDVGGEYAVPNYSGYWGLGAVMDGGVVLSIAAPVWVNDSRC